METDGHYLLTLHQNISTLVTVSIKPSGRERGGRWSSFDASAETHKRGEGKTCLSPNQQAMAENTSCAFSWINV